jgi:hypothetical protein
MFNKSFTCTVSTDEKGHFQSSTPVEGTHMFAIHAGIRATLISPADTAVSGTFAIAPAEPREFSGQTSDTIDLGKWQIAKGTNTATASGFTTPARVNTQLVVRFDASPA